MRRQFLDVQVKVCSASIDHSDAIASALVSVWPDVDILTCWEHLFRQLRKQTKPEKAKGFITNAAENHHRQLHLTQSLKQFRALSKGVLSAWGGDGEADLADWREAVYLTPHWERWSVNSSSIP